MKKTLLTGFVILSTWYAGYCQQPNNVNDDVYYQGDDDQQYNDQNNNTDYQDQQNQDNGGGPTYQTFYDQLSPYGSWINYPGYGYVWVPNNMDPSFQPYLTNGHWVYTDMGWAWVSDFDWGWGPFHYGRWLDDPSYGWLWVPGYDWAPAWVIWGDYDGYYGWACLGPGVLTPHYRPDPHYWHFVPHDHMGYPNITNYVVRNEDVAHGNIAELNNRVNVISHANTYHQSVFFTGPKTAEVERYTRQKITPVKVTPIDHPGPTKVNGNEVTIYRPNITRAQAPHGAPTKVTPAENIRPANRTTQTPATNNTVPQRPVQQQQQQQRQQQWTPPRQNTQRQENPSPAPVQRQAPAPERQSPPVQRNFIPTERYSPPPQQHFSAPPQQHFSAPSAPRGGGGGRR